MEKLDEARAVSVRFIVQLRNIQQSLMPDDTYLNERIHKASGYFLPLMNDIRDFCSECSTLEVDSKEINSKLKDVYEQLAVILDIKHGGMTLIQECKYTIGAYCRLKTSANLEDRKKSSPKKLKRLDAPTSVNEELRERLMQWRMDRFKKDNVPAYMIMHQTTLLDIATYVPQTRKELLSIKGFGETSFKKYGEEILAITAEFAKEG